MLDLRTLTAAAGVWMLACLGAHATTIMLPYDDYGHNQNDQGRCAATSMINSFEFLVNRHPAVYEGSNLLIGDPGSADSPIRQLDTLMGGIGCGVLDQQAWTGKLGWFDLYAPGTTTFAGMTDEDASSWASGDLVTRGIPTTAFLLSELQDGEDVEIGLGGANHWVTLIGMTVDDTTRLATSIAYIDPNCVNGTNAASPGPSVVPVALQGGALHFDWRNGNGLICDPAAATLDATIEVAFAESAVPEPAPLALLLWLPLAWAGARVHAAVHLRRAVR
jgi:hypothetical protein